MVNEKLRNEIKKRYKTESEFAESMGWTRQKLSKTIRGERSPKIADVNALSRAMGISVGEVISFFS